MTTTMAPFRTGIELITLDKRSPIPASFVLKLADELTPSYVTDGFRQTVVFHLILDSQALDTYDLVLTYDVSRELVLIITASIGNSGMDTSHLAPCFLTVAGPLLFLGVLPLRTGQLPLIFGEELGIAIGLPIGGDDHTLDAKIKPHYLGGNRQRLEVFLDQDGNEVAACRIFRDGQRFIQVPEGLLSGNRRDVIEPCVIVLFLKVSQSSGHLGIVPAFTTLIVGVRPLAQSPVVDVAHTPKSTGQNMLLLFGGVAPILVSSLLFHGSQDSMYCVKRQQVKGGRRFFPDAFARGLHAAW
jgi:hypothetical protein